MDSRLDVASTAARPRSPVATRVLRMRGWTREPGQRVARGSVAAVHVAPRSASLDEGSSRAGMFTKRKKHSTIQEVLEA